MRISRLALVASFFLAFAGPASAQTAPTLTLTAMRLDGGPLPQADKTSGIVNVFDPAGNPVFSKSWNLPPCVFGLPPCFDLSGKAVMGPLETGYKYAITVQSEGYNARKALFTSEGTPVAMELRLSPQQFDIKVRVSDVGPRGGTARVYLDVKVLEPVTRWQTMGLRATVYGNAYKGGQFTFETPVYWPLNNFLLWPGFDGVTNFEITRFQVPADLLPGDGPCVVVGFEGASPYDRYDVHSACGNKRP